MNPLSCPRHALLRLALCALLGTTLVAGCAERPEAPPPAAPPPRLHGWVLDPALRPVPGAVVEILGTGLQAPADVQGRYAFPAVAAGEVALRVAAPGHRPATLSVLLGPGEARTLNVTLAPLPSTEARVDVAHFRGFIACSGFVAAGHSHGGGDPEGEDTVDCPSDVGAAVWDLPIPANLTGLVLEVAWEPGTPLAKNLLVLVHALGPDDPVGEALAFGEGESVLRVQVASLALQDRFPDGGTVRVDVQIGGGPDQEDVAAGLAFQQPFDVYASLFRGERPPAGYAFVDA